MNYATARNIDRQDIPVIDLAGLSEGDAALESVAQALVDAAETVGFFYVKNHGIPQDLVDEVQKVGRAFFDHPDVEKQQVAVNKYHRGFIEMGEAKMYDEAKADLKESFIWGLDVGEDDADYQSGNPLIGPNQWPGFMPEMRSLMVRYMDACNALGARLLRAFAIAMDQPTDRFVECFDRPISRGALVYYPPQDQEMGEQQFGVAPHSDYGVLTLLNQDPVGGLQVMGKDGEWLMAHPIPGTFVVNVGDLLARWTNERFQSTEHRVVNSSGRERLSVAVFVDPNHDTVIDPVVTDDVPALYPPVTCGEYVLSRFDDSFAYRKGEAKDG